MQAIAPPCICSLSKSARYLTSRRRMLCARRYANRSFGEALSVTGRISFPLGDLNGIGKELPASPSGLCGIGGLAGDPGRLTNVLTTGVIGVLDGRSIATAKFLCGGDADASPL